MKIKSIIFAMCLMVALGVLQGKSEAIGEEYCTFVEQHKLVLTSDQLTCCEKACARRTEKELFQCLKSLETSTSSVVKSYMATVKEKARQQCAVESQSPPCFICCLFYPGNVKRDCKNCKEFKALSDCSQ